MPRNASTWASAASVLLFLLPCASGYQTYLSKIPNGDKTGCGPLGHADCVGGAPRNAFGLAFAASNRQWTKALCMQDSDGDGLSNGLELGDPCCVWQPGQTPARTTNISLPGSSASRTNATMPQSCPASATTQLAPGVVPLALALVMAAGRAAFQQ